LSESSPVSSLNRSAGTKFKRYPAREQIEQLHETTRSSVVFTSNFTLPQWQDPSYVFASGMKPI
jgi:hypothetical protein